MHVEPSCWTMQRDAKGAQERHAELEKQITGLEGNIAFFRERFNQAETRCQTEVSLGLDGGIKVAIKACPKAGELQALSKSCKSCMLFNSAWIRLICISPSPLLEVRQESLDQTIHYAGLSSR